MGGPGPAARCVQGLPLNWHLSPTHERRYFIVGGADSGTVGSQHGVAAASGHAANPADGVFGPGVIGAPVSRLWGGRPSALHHALRLLHGLPRHVARLQGLIPRLGSQSHALALSRATLAAAAVAEP